MATPSVAGPVPRGSGSGTADDVNGDGYADLVYAAPALGAPSADGDDGRSAYLGVVYGSPRGLDPTTRTVIEPEDTRLPPYLAPGTLPTADLDGDGFADILAGGHVVWGGPTGPRDSVPAAELGGVPGDFDGDGRQDLAVTEAVGEKYDEQYQLRVLYGPFTREGKPRRTGAARPSPVAEAGLGYEDADFSLTAGDADGDRATDLVVTAHGDDEQEPAVLLHGGEGPGGFAVRASYLRTGSSVAFGDFDGDGKGDVAVGDNGTRNGEPGADAQDPAVHDTVTVHYGGNRPDKRLKPGASGDYLTEDIDDDGRDELLISVEGGVRILRGSADGLSTDKAATVRRDGAGEEVPAAERSARFTTVRDFDRDGRAEVVFGWSPVGERGGSTGPSRWWVLEGGTDTVTAFTDAKFFD
ncbi:FG-GAP repeat domain-containing protein [Streptomyces phaeolivaceus]|uniref:FG-GAP repeat domain-containing protein n=1 Tax=Streptomyces phaeolivaceus TaxID=2653200 RepID=UPI001869E881|nr:VCBS repeat-containing protein [Streptomyces phaeolivaceus]